MFSLPGILTFSVYYFLDLLVCFTVFLNLSPPSFVLLVLTCCLWLLNYYNLIHLLVNKCSRFSSLQYPRSAYRFHPWPDGGFWFCKTLVFRFFLDSFITFDLYFWSDACHLHLFHLSSWLYIHSFILASSLIEYIEFWLYHWLIFIFHAPNFIKTLSTYNHSRNWWGKKIYRKVGIKTISFHKGR